MRNHYSPFFVLGACFLQACTTPVANRAAVIVPFSEVRHSANMDAATYAALGKYHHDRGEFDLAREAYLQSIALDRHQLASRNALAAIDARQGRLTEATEMLKSVVADFPAVAYPISNLGYLYYLQGQYDSAVTLLEHAVALDATNDRARSNLRLAKAAEGSQQELAKIKQSISARSESAQADVTARLDADPVISKPSGEVKPVTAAEPVSVAVSTARGTPFLSVMTKSRFDLVKTAANVFELKTRAPHSSAVLPPNISDGSIEIANGNGVHGLAGRLRPVLARQGFVIARLSNAPPYSQQVTEIRYRAGYQNQATRLRAALHDKYVVLHAMQWTGPADIKLVLGKDAVSRDVPNTTTASASLAAQRAL